MGSFPQSMNAAVEEITRIHKSLPTRPSLDNVEAAVALIRNIDKEEQSRIDAISKQKKGNEVPEELFVILQEMQKNMVFFQSKQQKREALKLLDLENTHAIFDEFIQRASKSLSSSESNSPAGHSNGSISPSPTIFSGRSASTSSGFDPFTASSSSGSSGSFSMKERRNLELITRDDICLKKPKSSFRVDGIHTTTDPSRGLPLDASVEAITDSGTFGKLSRLEELDLGANQLSSLPDTFGNLVNLKKLNIETNDVEELPHLIGHCASLVELRADYNHLKALPEAIGRLESLKVLSVRYNNIKALPTTMASMSSLKELDVSFNELESVPESLCLATSLVKMNLGNNFADLQSLPRSIGNLEMLEELDISNNQIRVIPDSFGMLLKLRVLRIEENPLEVPPRHVAEMGAEAAVSYMAEHVAKRDVRSQPVKARKTWAPCCFFPRPNKRKHDGLDYVIA